MQKFGGDFVNRFSGGTLILSGGGRPPRNSRAFSGSCGTDAAVAVIPAQPMTRIGLRQTIIRTWQSVGATRVTPLAAGTRQEAESPEFLAKLRK